MADIRPDGRLRPVGAISHSPNGCKVLRFWALEKARSEGAHAAARVHHSSRRFSLYVAARRTRTATRDTADRLHLERHALAPS